MKGKPLNTFDILLEAIGQCIAYGLSLDRDVVITVNADFKWMVRRE